jgi:hypothetical protein
MIASKKLSQKSEGLSDFARRATRAMCRAQKEAEKENARYGMALILSPKSRLRTRKNKSVKP